ncbi:PDR/VanB family oxidoreductase [Domibacillus sp. DTU_2020_1001157_1_SI_ALB_TIR_016]|uniref:PDR/VanB family oxidoreductase n=1 Tax=Domibacillus sp. DTU_2020_1001157_1_SI_ALB_TIR_016 TaxID=3077789 RepID=UPI0028E91E55|nr:PDR/VanB family oxidoreductase [Domibacillus sp. DTU_2020_1001157_1_SI_ALB_TIR_016]WNS78039.1 PDR/VanB family oxidoreductase [Domibacillus sp. DTU_2020_1001157_1_SI_ALB_TIR_016]
MTNAVIDVFVADIKEESPSVKSFTLVPAENVPLPRFSAGSHITTFLPKEDGVLERHYSLTSHPADTSAYQIAIRRQAVSKEGSVYWHSKVQKGARLQISYPKNHFPLSFQAKHHVFFAAGIGITPFLAMTADLKRKEKSFELHYAAPSNEQCAFYSFLKQAYPEQTHFYFSDRQQRMHTSLLKQQPIGTHVYFCGSEAMMNEFAEAAKKYGYLDKSIHFERFSPPDFGPSHPLQVKLKQSGETIPVSENETVLDALLAHGVKAPYSCKVGGCGSCLVPVSGGEVDHRDFFLTDLEKAEENVMLTCVSRAKTDCLVLDL